MARLVTAGGLAAVRRGRFAGVPERRLLIRAGRGRSRGCGGGGSGPLRGLGHPQCIATLDHLLRGVEGQHVDQSADVAQQFAEEKGDLRHFKRRWLQGGQVVPQNRGPGVAAAHGVIEPLVGPLLVTKAIGSQEELLQVFVRVGDGGGVPQQRADGGDQREGQLRHGTVEFCDGLSDVCRGEGGIEAVEPALRGIGVNSRTSFFRILTVCIFFCFF